MAPAGTSACRRFTPVAGNRAVSLREQQYSPAPTPGGPVRNPAGPRTNGFPFFASPSGTVPSTPPGLVANCDHDPSPAKVRFSDQEPWAPLSPPRREISLPSARPSPSKSGSAYSPPVFSPGPRLSPSPPRSDSWPPPASGLSFIDLRGGTARHCTFSGDGGPVLCRSADLRPIKTE